MNYSVIKKCDIANGPGCRVVLFVSGCTHHCQGCFQPETWNFSYGQTFTEDTATEILQLLSPSYIAGLTLLGGEPFEPENQPALLALCRRVREAYPLKTIWAFSGWTYEALRARRGDEGNVTTALLGCLDVLVDGQFVLAQKNLNLRFRGSSNQRILDLPKTMQTGLPVCWDDTERTDDARN